MRPGAVSGPKSFYSAGLSGSQRALDGGGRSGRSWPRRQDRCCAACRLRPNVAVLADPADDRQHLGVVSLQVSPMNRFVMGNEVAEIVEPLHPVAHIGSDLFGVNRIRVMGKRRGDGRHPQGGQVTGGAEVPPEPEAQFGEDLDAAARAAALLAGRSSLRFFDVAPLAGPASALKERPSAVPRLRPTRESP